MSTQPLKLIINPPIQNNLPVPAPAPVNLQVISNLPKQPQIVSLVTSQPSQKPSVDLQVKQPVILQPGSLSGQNNSGYRVSASAYQKYQTTRDHIYNVTDSYIGCDKIMPRSERILNLQSRTFQESEVTFPEGCENIYVELIANVSDNVSRSVRNGVDPGEVIINMNRETISVKNGGVPIPIEIHPSEKMWAPQLIFGELHTSSNYNKNVIRTECGRNGYGAKLTNIFSKEFIVTVGDPYNKKLYQQVWRNNMLDRQEPQISDYNGPSFVEVVYKMEFKRFGYDQYPDEAFALFARHAADLSFTAKVPVTFNGIRLNVQNSVEYAKLYLGEEALKRSIVYYQWPPGVKTITKKNGLEVAENPNISPIVEICAVDTPDMALNVSFANGKWTRNGGVHADAAFKAVSKGVLDTVNGTNAGTKKSKAAKSSGVKLTIADVKRHISVFVSCWVGDPTWDNQYKTALKTPAPKIVIDEKILQPIMKWELINRLYAELEAKHFRAGTKTDGKKRKHISDLKGEDANDAGTAKSGHCTLYITEGKSAMGFAVKMLSLFERGRDFIGLLPLKGKPLNVMNALEEQIQQNSEIIELKKMLGLRERTNYLLDENFNTLRYGQLMILADADTDGKHILGLVLNLFHCRYPTLLARGYVRYLRTKIVEVKGKGKVFKFYNEHDYDEWKKITPDYANKTKWDHAYFKGLGSSEDADIADEFRAPKVVQCFYDDKTPDAMQLAFNEKFADERKDWIKNWTPDFAVEAMEMQPISAFINHELIQFSIADIARSIPRFMDGMKRVQRKIVWGSMKKWKGKAGSNKAEKVKVGNLASYVSEKTEYHHGPTSMCDAIVNMVQDFTGSNNLPYFCAHGQFGTRNLLGRDASDTRYTKTKPQWWWKYVFKAEDNPLLQMVVDEGKECEPVTFLPVIPFNLINGFSGIGTGHSTFGPNHDPLDLCQWLTAKNKGAPLPAVLPWYRGFKGTIKLVERGKRKKPINNPSPSPDNVVTLQIGKPLQQQVPLTGNDQDIPDQGDEDENDEDNVAINQNTKYTMVTTGNFEVVGNVRKKVIVTELPIGRGMHDYDKWLAQQREQKLITDFTNLSKHDTVYFEITGMKNTPNHKNLRLIRSYGMSNMVLLDNNDRPVKYDSTSEILETFYAIRLPYYQLRKDNILKELQAKIDLLNLKIRFIIAVITGYHLLRSNANITLAEILEKGGILTIGLNGKDIVPQMRQLGFPDDLLDKVNLKHCTLDDVEILRHNLQKLLNEKVVVEGTSPQSMWQTDIDEFVAAYCKEYKCKPTIKKTATLSIV